jgi:hypothetical protein
MAEGFSLRRLFFKDGGSVRAPKDIAPGMRFKEKGKLGSVWVVTRTVKPFASAIPHVVIAPENVASEARVISTHALRDASFYKYLPPAPPAETPKA